MYLQYPKVYERGMHASAKTRAASHLAVFINSSAGTSKTDEVRRLAEIFSASGFKAEITLVQHGEEIPTLARRAVANGSRAVVAGGGDGTINAVASALVGTDTPLGVLPLGTLNHFAKDLQIPLDLEGAARTIATGRVVRVDVGEVNGHLFLNNSGVGLYPRIVREREKQQRGGHNKWIGLLLAGVPILRRLPSLKLHLTADGQVLRCTALFVFVGNNVYEMEGLSLGARTCLNAGQLSLWVAHYNGLRGLVGLCFRALLGRLHEQRDFERLCVKELQIQARAKRLPVAFDGEVSKLELPLHYRVRPQALGVLVPAEEGEGSG
jgi:diacylglycerol kinase family enzyme